MDKHRAWFALALSGAVGCGQITERTVHEADVETGSSGGSQGGRAGTPVFAGQAGMVGPPGSAGMPAMDRAAPAPSPTPLNSLSRWEYARSVQALTGTPITRALPADGETLPPFDVSMNLNGLAIEALFAEAEAQGAASAQLDLLPCDASAADIDCVTQFVQRVVGRAFRRPLSPQEQLRYSELFMVASSADGAAAGVAAVVQAALLAPQFLYKAYLGSGAVGPGMLTALTAHEIASRLSYLLTGAPPDDALRDAAESGALSALDGLDAHARRLMSTPQFLEAAQHFHAQWFELAGLDRVNAPELTPELRESMRGSADAFVGYIYQNGAQLQDLLQSTAGFVDAVLAPVYGLQAPSSGGFTQFGLDPAVRAGLLTHAATLTRFDNPTQRGLLVRRRLLCVEVPPPPPVVIPDVVVQPGQTRRQAWEQHRTDPVCASCHQLMDPIGFGFEGFDELGRYRSVDNGLPVDDSGELLQAGEIDSPFVGATELASRLSASSLVTECFTKTWWSYATQRPLTDSDSCTLAELTSGFRSANLQIRELLVQLVRSERFRYRDAHVVPSLPEPSGPAGSVSGLAERRRLVLDFAVGELKWFAGLTPQADRPLLDQHLTALRELEGRLAQVGPGPMP